MTYVAGVDSSTQSVKVVVCDRGDFDWAVAHIRAHRLTERCAVLLGPVHGMVEAAELADWILASGLPLRLQVQLHKQLWGVDTRGV